MTDKLPTSDAEWRAKLTPEQYRVTRRQGTERAFTGEYWNCHDASWCGCAAEAAARQRAMPLAIQG